MKLHDMVSFTSQPIWGEVTGCGFIHKKTYLRWSSQMWLHPQENPSEVKLLDVASSTRKPIWGEVTGCGFIHKKTYLRWNYWMCFIHKETHMRCSYQMWFHPQGNPSEVKLLYVVSSTSQQISVKQQQDNILPRGTCSICQLNDQNQYLINYLCLFSNFLGKTSYFHYESWFVRNIV